MAEYIDRQKMIDDFTGPGGCTVYGEYVHAIVSRINAQPIADAVEVVRCKDCKWFVYDMDLNHEKYPNEIEADGICQITDKYCDMPNFCSYGERK